jgi:hypothetical protein
MPRIIVQIEWDTPDQPLWLNADNVAIALHSYCKNTKFKVASVLAGLSASEAIYGFVSWLTTRPKRVVMSSQDDAGSMVGLIVRFCEANHFAKPRTGWANTLIHPAAQDEEAE